MSSQTSREINRRRTFAIISHPDAGKTTLTEKLLLYGGAVELAGSVTAGKKQRATTSDWMELEKKRGISVSSTVLQFDYDGYRINLLDTPGHRDFSEDTYRVLTAVDAAVMVIDAGKGIEPQTRKLFEVCRRRGVPIFTFMNKLDRPTLELLGLLDELESVLGIQCCAVNWPVGTGPDFRGIFDRLERKVHLFERTAHGAYRAPVKVSGLDDPTLRSQLDEQTYHQFVEEVQMLDAAGHEFDPAAVLRGELTPVLFGSAANNFGVEALLNYFLKYSSPPTGRQAQEQTVSPEDEAFSAFIFKIQANMDPRHRDRLAFLRVVSGRFSRDMSVTHVQTGRKVRLASAHSLFGREREIMEEAWPGDVIGIVGGRDFGIGDTLTEDPKIAFEVIPRFVPECFAMLHNPNTSEYKRFDQGLQQLLQEGVIQAFSMPSRQQRVPLLGAVGPLQFDIVRYRLESEYGVESRIEHSTWKHIKWPAAEYEELIELVLPSGAGIALDHDRRPVLLFDDEWTVRFFRDKYKQIELHDERPGAWATGAVRE